MGEPMTSRAPITVRRATADDLDHIVEFNVEMARETESLALDPAIVGAGAARLLARSEYGYYLVAERDGAIAGGLLVTYEWSDWRDGLIWWIQSVYVRPAHRRTGVYRALHRHVCDAAAADDDVRAVRLYVERDNQSAQSTYESMGMTRTPYLVYEVPVGK